ncbi:hypothetical protein, partial [Prevotella sp.]
VCAWVKEFVRLILIIPIFSYLLRRYSFLFYRGKVAINIVTAKVLDIKKRLLLCPSIVLNIALYISMR